MIKWSLRRAIDKYDAGYKRDMIDASSRAAWLFSRVTDPLAAALVVGVGLAVPAAAQVSVQPAAVSVYTMSPGESGPPWLLWWG
jgi:hypothetical protein